MSDSHGVLAHHFDTLEQQREAQLTGMWLFLGTELLIFGVMFTGYAAYRTKYSGAFEVASQHLNVLIGGINTVVLLTSSLTMALAVHATRAGKRTTLLTCLILTTVLGTAFMGIKAVEYYIDYQEKLVPGLAFDTEEWTQLGVSPNHVQLFLMFYYIMTGLHAVHLTVGIALLVILIVRAYLGHFTPMNYMGVELFGLYWHFVDIIWIFLLPLLYLIGTRHSLW